MQYGPIGNVNNLGNTQTPPPDVAGITTVSLEILPANECRRATVLTNIGNKDAYVAFGQTAIAGSGIVIFKGDSVAIGVIDDIRMSIEAVTATGVSTIAIQEFE